MKVKGNLVVTGDVVEAGNLVTGGTSLGGQEAIFSGANIPNLEFKGLTAGSNITLTPSGTDITIESSGGGSGTKFYGVNVKQVDADLGDVDSWKGINTLSFDNNYFYLTQNPPNTDEVLANFRFTGNETIPGSLTLKPSGVAEGISLHSPFANSRSNIFHTLQSTPQGAALLIDPLTADGASSTSIVGLFRFTAASASSGVRIHTADQSAGINSFLAAQSIGQSYLHGDGSGRVGIGTNAPEAGNILTVEGGALFKNETTSRGKLTLQGGVQGFYLPMAEDVRNEQPEDGQILVFDESTGTWGPESSPASLILTDGSNSYSSVGQINFNDSQFYLSGDLSGNPVVNRIEDVYIVTAVVSGSSTNSVVFSGIPSMLGDRPATRLLIDILARSDRASQEFDTLSIRFNGDSGTNYNSQRSIVRDNSTVAAVTDFGVSTFATLADIPASNADTGNFGACAVVVTGAFSSVFKSFTCTTYTTGDTGGAAGVRSRTAFNGGTWEDTSIINSVELRSDNNFIAGSTFVLKVE